MAIIDPGYASASRLRQDLFTISNPIPNVPQYDALPSPVTVVLNTPGLTIGTDISFNTTTGIISLSADLTYNLSAVIPSNVPGATCQWYNVTTGNTIGFASDTGMPVSATINPAVPTQVKLLVIAPAGTKFEYPAQVTNARAAVTVIGGFEV